MSEPFSRSECVRRALLASEIAESCFQAEIRASFLALAADWLSQAEHPEPNDRSGALSGRSG